ncbi:MAG: hypothetical protein JNL98_12080 [Bryobacterales bacterium]|nr:hypothetical protein [Bryobacterales bacterium]
MIPNVLQTGAAEARRAALEEVLNSRTFDRSDQLKAFLRYVCEMDTEGRGAELNEYLIGVEVLGRPDGYSPAEDAIVRNRAFALRRKLEEYYTRENGQARIRIEIPRGQYAPRFHTVTASPVTVPPVTGPLATELPASAPPEITPALEEHTLPPAPNIRRIAAISFAIGLAVASIGWATWRSLEQQAKVPAALRAAWGPLLNGPEATFVHISSPLHLFVRPNETRMPGERPQIDSGALQRWYREIPSLPPANELFVRPTPNAPLWGDAMSMSIVGRVLERSGVPWDVLPSRVAAEPLIRKRNAIVLGRPEYSRLVAKLMQRQPLTVDYHPGLREYAIREVSNDQWLLPKYGANDYADVVYGLITVLPSEGSPGGEHRTVILTGTNSAGAQAAAEFWTSARELASLRERMGAFPASYQVVVRATASATMALDIFYETHRVVTPAGTRGE